MSPHRLPPDAAERLEELAGRLSLPEYDLLLVGDGSGTVFHKPAGWACVAYDRGTRRALLHTGAVSGGTNNFAELMPYAHALWFENQSRARTGTAPVRVQVVSDSELTVRCGNGVYARRANGCLWAAVEWFEGNGYRLSWRHVPRNSNAFSSLADSLAGRVRRLLADAMVTRQSEGLLEVEAGG